MLVLSRKEKQDFLFPNLGITVQILRVRGKSVRVGIVAPENVRVLRSELPDKPGQTERQPTDAEAEAEAAPPKESAHELRNRLNTVQLALSLIQAQLEGERYEEAESTLSKALEQLTELDKAAQQPGGLQRRRALVVEDSAQERELLAEYLRLHGFDVDVAADGEEALDYLACHPSPDVVLLDMNMPNMNGLRTAEAIRGDARHDQLKVVMVSGSDPRECVTDGEPSPFDHWFMKPIQPRQFLDQIESQLQPASKVADAW